VEFKAICSVASGGTAVIGGKEIVAPSFDRLITVKIRDGKSEMRRAPKQLDQVDFVLTRPLDRFTSDQADNIQPI
jgi:hypothetical protein